MIFDFFITYWKLIMLVVLLLINILISIIRKPKVLNTVIDCINGFVPTAINEAEKALGNGNGAAKLNYAINHVLNYLEFRFNINGYALEKYKKYIALEIEEVLSTPQKKGE